MRKTARGAIFAIPELKRGVADARADADDGTLHLQAERMMHAPDPLH